MNGPLQVSMHVYEDFRVYTKGRHRYTYYICNTISCRFKKKERKNEIFYYIIHKLFYSIITCVYTKRRIGIKSGRHLHSLCRRFRMRSRGETDRMGSRQRTQILASDEFVWRTLGRTRIVQDCHGLERQFGFRIRHYCSGTVPKHRGLCVERVTTICVYDYCRLLRRQCYTNILGISPNNR